MTATVGIDIGGSSITAVVRDESSRIVRRHRCNGSLDGGPQVVASAVAAWRALEAEDCVAVGVGVPGQVDASAGAVSLAVNLGIGPEHFPLAGRIAEEIGLPVFIENDVRMAALGAHEARAIGGAPVESLVLVNIGTGISAGAIVDGSLVRGAHGLAGEVGHVVVDEAGPPCPCGQRGCLEAVAAGPAIGRVWSTSDGESAATGLFSAASQGDPAARRAAQPIIEHLTTALTWLAATYDPEVILLAGGVTSAGDDLLEALRDEVGARAATSVVAARRLRPEQVVMADREDPPGPRGAAALAARQVSRVRVSPASKQASNE